MRNIIEVLGKEKIKSRARDLVSESILPGRVEIIENLDYKLYIHDSTGGCPLTHVFTIILTSNGNNVDYFRESIESVLKQKNGNYELILVDHGCESDLKNLIYSYFLTNKNIKLITFKENLYDPKATTFFDDRFSNVLNSALFCSEGDYVYFLSYDDFLSENYVECMCKLFIENPKCIVASPSVQSVNEVSALNIARTEWLRENNVREKYMSGIDLAMSVIRQKNLFMAPGGLCCYRTDMVLAAGGLDCMNDLSQIFKFSVMGDVGTCEKAILYWRHHNNQTNKKNKKFGSIYYALNNDWLRHIEIFYAANNISGDYIKVFRKFIGDKIHSDTIGSIRDGIRSGFQGVMGVFFEIYKTAPAIYMGYFLLFCFIDGPYILYNTLPEMGKTYCRRIKIAVSICGKFFNLN